MDVDTIDAGVDFVKVLEEAVQSCDVLVALIGRRWLNLKDENGARRLDNPEDFVRVEIATALERDIRVIPVLVGGASMPGSIELPENLHSLARRNALTVNHATFHADMSRLIEHLERALQAAEDSKVLKAKKLQEEQVRKERRAQVEKRLHQADTAINLSDWSLAGEKLKEILALAPGHLEAQAKLEFVKEKLAALEEQKKIESREKEEARKRKEKQEREAAAKAQAERLARDKTKAEERARQAALRKERQREIVERVKTFFAGMGKLPFYITSGMVLLFIFGYIISNIELPIKPEPTKTPAASTPATVATSTLPISTDTPIRELGVSSTMVSEKDGMVMVYVPAGDFQMGSENGDDDEMPVHTVYLDAFWIDQTEVTNEMFAAFLNAEGNQSEGGVAWLDEDDGDERIHKVGDTWRADSGYGDHPVIEVSWYGANAYCEWVGRRLPTEAEWEKAAGWDADTKVHRTYPWGELIDDSYANYNQNVEDTTPVGSYDKGTSFYRVYDMAGNVWEWVADWYGRDYYKNSTAGNNPTGPSSGNHRVLRGGSWFYGESNIRSANRNLLNDPSIPSISSSDIGFRCSRSAAAPESSSTSLPKPTATATKIPSTPTLKFDVDSTTISDIDGMVMVYVPAGEFQMGSEDGNDDEKPAHTVYLDAFWIDQTEVTNDMYYQCEDAGYCDPPESRESNTRESYYENPDYSDFPVINVSWSDANTYCWWTGRRLPTEAEWEKAAGWNLDTGIQRTYPWGDSIDESYANYDGNVGDTTVVSSYEKGVSYYGAYDMAGNVYEWVADWYGIDYYNNSPSSNPTGPSSGEYRVLRGGSWNFSHTSVRSANRGWSNPSITGGYTGFRCSLSQP